jgi:hypothetical protein
VRVETLNGTIAMSLLNALGYEKMGRLTLRDIFLTALATIPLLPALPFLREFMYVVARAVPLRRAAGVVPGGSRSAGVVPAGRVAAERALPSSPTPMHAP